MFDQKTAREEMAKLHAEAVDHVEKFSAVDETEEDTKAQSERFARIEKIAKSLDDAERLAKYAYTKEQPKDAPAIKSKPCAVMATSGPDVQAVERTSYSKEEYSQALSNFVKGAEPETYATISVSGNSAIIPTVVSPPLTPTRYNCYRAAAKKLSIPILTYGNTAPVVVPVIYSTSGGAVTDGVQNTPNDADPTVIGVSVAAHAYHSKTYWYQNEVINAEQFDVVSSTLPALQGARELGFASGITAAIKGDATITQSVSSATSSTISIDNLDDLIHSCDLLYDNNKALFLGMDSWNYCEKLKDSNGRPIFEFQTVQDDSFVSYKGVPVFKHNSFDLLGTPGNLIGVAISFDGFKLRDEMEKLIKYIDQAGFTDQTGLDNLRYQGWGYVSDNSGARPGAITLFEAGSGS